MYNPNPRKLHNSAEQSKNSTEQFLIQKIFGRPGKAIMNIAYIRDSSSNRFLLSTFAYLCDRVFRFGTLAST